MKPDALAGPIPGGMRVWTEGGKPLTGDPYRKSEPDPGRLIIIHQWRDTQGITAQVVGCAFLWIIVALFAGGGTNRTGSLLLRQSRADRELILRHRSRPHFCSTSRRRAPN